MRGGEKRIFSSAVEFLRLTAVKDKGNAGSMDAIFGGIFSRAFSACAHLRLSSVHFVVTPTQIDSFHEEAATMILSFHFLP